MKKSSATVRCVTLLGLAACSGETGPRPTPPGKVDGGVDAAPWLDAVRARIAAGARQPVPDGDRFLVSLDGGDAVATFDAYGVTLGARNASAPLALRFVRWGRADDLVLVEPEPPLLGDCVQDVLPAGTCGRRLEYPHPGVTAWWVGLHAGVEFGWTVEAPPAGSGDLRLEVEVEGADWMAPRDGGGELVDAAGETWLLSGALAWDADGEPLPAWVQVEPGRISVGVDATGARYPVTVDPVLSTATTRLEGDTSEDFGAAVAGAGDVNGDGYDDVIVGAPWYTVGHYVNGAAYVFHGSAAGVSETAATTIVGGSDDSLGYGVGGAGDVDGDGYDDVIVGAIHHGSTGAAYVHHGSASGVSSSPVTTLTGPSGAGAYGYRVGGAGDVDGDGYDDVLVGDYMYDDGSVTAAGGAFVYHGSASGVSSTATTTLTGATTFDGLGVSVAGAGDVNGDGYDDVIVGAWLADGSGASSGAAYVHHGSASGVSSTAATTIAGEATGDYLGISVSGAGDVDGDGYDDVIVGARLVDIGSISDAGAAYVHHGSASGVSETAATTLYGDEAASCMGDAVAGAGDVDGDGYDDVVVGAYQHDGDAGSNAGAAYLFLGSSAGVAGSAATTLQGAAAGDYLGIAVAGAGDVDGDGYDDVVIGASGFDAGSILGAGAAYLHHGYVDADGDGYTLGGDGNSRIDCDDSDATVGSDPYYPDTDADGYGDPDGEVYACETPTGYVDDATDCDDTRPDVHPGADEVCDDDDADEDCDGLVDDADDSVDAATLATVYVDADADGYGTTDHTAEACDAPEGYAARAGDCDDTRADVSPAGTEVCDAGGADEDCDGLLDEDDDSLADAFYADADGDGYGEPDTVVHSCEAPSGYVADATDCDDTRADVNPGATEVCDPADTDEDCDGLADDDDPSVDPASLSAWYRDADGDGFGAAGEPRTACEPGPWVDNSDDCDDFRADVHPGAPDPAGDGVDGDCDGVDPERNDTGAPGDDDTGTPGDDDTGTPGDDHTDEPGGSDDSGEPKDDTDTSADGGVRGTGDEPACGCVHAPGRFSGPALSAWLAVLVGVSRRRG